MTADAVLFDGATKRYGRVTALNALSLSIPRGTMFGLIGPDGAGKTTAMRLACGLLRPDGGTVRVLGHDPVADRRAVTRVIGYLSQRFSLYGDLTIDENIAFHAEVHGMRRYEPARDRLLEMTQLTAFRTRRADRLSGGMKQKLALACTLVHQPDLLMLDEPTTGVDPVSRGEFWKLLSEFLTQGLTIVMTTPYLDEAERCARVGLLHEGRLLAAGTPARLQEQLPGQLWEVIADTPRPPLEVLTAVRGVADVQVFGDRLHVRLDQENPSAAARAIEQTLRQHAVPIVSVRRIPPSLEDVFIEFVTRAGTEPGAANSRSGG